MQFLVSVEEFRGHRYLDDLQSVPRTRTSCPTPGLATTGSPAAAGERARRIVDAMTETVTAADPLVIMFTSGSSGAPKGVVHSHGNALGAVRSGLAARCITSDTRLYLPMPFFWVGGFGSGILSALLAGATLVTEEIPRPETTLRLLETRTGQAVSRLARSGRGAGAARRARSALICRRCGRAAWKRCSRPSSGPRPGRGPRCSA